MTAATTRCERALHRSLRPERTRGAFHLNMLTPLYPGPWPHGAMRWRGDPTCPRVAIRAARVTVTGIAGDLHPDSPRHLRACAKRAIHQVS